MRQIIVTWLNKNIIITQTLRPMAFLKFKVLQPQNDPSLIDFVGKIAKELTPHLFAGTQVFKF